MTTKKRLLDIGGRATKPRSKDLSNQFFLWQKEFLRPAPWFDSSELFIVALQRCMRVFGRLVARFTAQSSLSDLDYHVLWALVFESEVKTKRGLSIALLTRMIGAANPSVVSIAVKRLQKRKLVKRPTKAKAHTRGRGISVTTEGRQVVQNAFHIFMREAPKVTSQYCGFERDDEKTMAQFLHFLLTIMKGMERYLSDIQRIEQMDATNDNAWDPRFFTWSKGKNLKRP